MDNLTGITDKNGGTRTFTYDGLDRVVVETWWNGAVSVRDISYAYDAVGNLLTASDPDSAYAFTYDAVNRVTSVDNAGTPQLPHVVLSYAYDAFGNVLTTSDNFGVQVGSVYDDRNLLVQRTWDGGVDPVQMDFSYNARGERTEPERSPVAMGPLPVVRSTYVSRPKFWSHFFPN